MEWGKVTVLEKKRNRIMPSRVEQERLRNYLCFSELERGPFDPAEQPSQVGKRGIPKHLAGEETEAQRGKANCFLKGPNVESKL